MIRHGHSEVMTYDYPFFETALEELSEGGKEEVLSSAYAVRVAGASNDDWKKFVNEQLPKVPKPKKSRVNDHAKNLEFVKRLGRVH